MLAKGVEKFGYTSISRESGIARSTLYRIIQGDITDVKLSTAQLIQTTIMALRKKST
jgi:predicted transcriptional regulator